MKAKYGQRVFETIDVWLASFLSLHEQTPSLELKNNRVIFCFPQSDELYKLISKFNANTSVPVANFAAEVKTLKARMFQVREQKMDKEKLNKEIQTKENR